MSELKCCPFCGGKAEVGHTNHHDKLFVVGCNTPICYGNINRFTMVFVSKESAINIWNTRKPMANIVEKLEEKHIDISGNTSLHYLYSEGYVDALDYVSDIVKQEINNGLE